MQVADFKYKYYRHVFHTLIKLSFTEISKIEVLHFSRKLFLLKKFRHKKQVVTFFVAYKLGAEAYKGSGKQKDEHKKEPMCKHNQKTRIICLFFYK